MEIFNLPEQKRVDKTMYFEDIIACFKYVQNSLSQDKEILFVNKNKHTFYLKKVESS